LIVVIGTKMAAIDARRAVPLVLTLNGGFVDTASFLALQGLFTAHVTGNFVTLGAALVLGTSGAIAKLLTLPVFCVVVIASRLTGTMLRNRSLPAFEILIGVKILFLVAGAVFAIHFGPFHDGDSLEAIATGMLLVTAMAIQNAVHRVHLGSAPPSTIMTGTTTQLMLDIADKIYSPGRQSVATSPRLVPTAINILIFGIGCGAAALAYARFGVGCFIVPPLLAMVSLVARLAQSSEADS
jgi:uncharacterized membrane protein YoaK (UPF0700 family)